MCMFLCFHNLSTIVFSIGLVCIDYQKNITVTLTLLRQITYFKSQKLMFSMKSHFPYMFCTQNEEVLKFWANVWSVMLCNFAMVPLVFIRILSKVAQDLKKKTFGKAHCTSIFVRAKRWGRVDSAPRPIPGVPKKAERSIYVTLIFENIAYVDFVR